MTWLDAACWSFVVVLVLELVVNKCSREGAKHYHSTGRMWSRITLSVFIVEAAALAVWLFCAANAVTRFGGE